MLEIIAVLCLLGAVVILLALSVIDLKVGLLPNELVLGFTALGFVFHLTTLFHFLDLQDMALGGFIGGGILYLIRGVANYFYKADTLGLGDVKLLAAGGIWLGGEYILIAMSLGALAGFFHGLSFAIANAYKNKAPINFKTLSIPAGPGFAVGIVIAAVIKFRDLPAVLPL